MNSEETRPQHPAGKTIFNIRLAVYYRKRHQFRYKYGAQFFWWPENQCWYWLSDNALPKDLVPFVAPTEISQAKIVPRLSLELIPCSCWFSNVRTHVTCLDWQDIAQLTRRVTDDHCQICWNRVDLPRLDCHEVFEYDDTTNTQKLIGFEALCKSCHMVKHFGLARYQGKEKEALLHLSAINGWSMAESLRYADEQLKTCRARSTKLWNLDLSYLKTHFALWIRPESAEKRCARANAFYDQRVEEAAFKTDLPSSSVMRDAEPSAGQEQLYSAYRRLFAYLSGK